MCSLTCWNFILSLILSSGPTSIHLRSARSARGIPGPRETHSLYSQSAPFLTSSARILILLKDPADINVIEGKYPFKPRAREGIVPKEQAMLSGNEGVAIVEEIGAEVSSLKKGDKVISQSPRLSLKHLTEYATVAAPQMGTWQSRQILNANQLLPVSNKLSDLQAATLQTNPPTAYRMLKDFTSLQQGQWVIQNGGNSAVGQAAIQLCKAWGIHTINLIRDR